MRNLVGFCVEVFNYIRRIPKELLAISHLLMTTKEIITSLNIRWLSRYYYIRQEQLFSFLHCQSNFLMSLLCSPFSSYLPRDTGLGSLTAGVSKCFQHLCQYLFGAQASTSQRVLLKTLFKIYIFIQNSQLSLHPQRCTANWGGNFGGLN